MRISRAVVSHICTSHVTHVNEFCVILHIYTTHCQWVYHIQLYTYNHWEYHSVVYIHSHDSLSMNRSRSCIHILINEYIWMICSLHTYTRLIANAEIAHIIQLCLTYECVRCHITHIHDSLSINRSHSCIHILMNEYIWMICALHTYTQLFVNEDVAHVMQLSIWGGYDW